MRLLLCLESVNVIQLLTVAILSAAAAEVAFSAC